jgi:hypothetical protein
MRNLKDIILERLILSKDKSHQKDFVNINHVDWDEFMDNFSKMNNPSIYLKLHKTSNNDKYRVVAEDGYQGIQSLIHKQINDIYIVNDAFNTLHPKYIVVEINTRPLTRLNVHNMEELLGIFGKDQLEEIYAYILEHAGN